MGDPQKAKVAGEFEKQLAGHIIWSVQTLQWDACNLQRKLDYMREHPQRPVNEPYAENYEQRFAAAVRDLEGTIYHLTELEAFLKQYL